MMVRMTLRHFGMAGLGMVLAFGTANGQAQKAELPGPIDSLSDLQDAGKMFFKIADENNDGQISQKEAIDAGNVLVGGFFFRADANGDGVLSPEEANQAKESFFAMHPVARSLMQAAQPAPAAGQPLATPGSPTPTASQNPLLTIKNLIDSNNDKQIQATELRQAVQTTVQAFYASADTNRDGQLSPTEVNASIVGIANAAAQAAFQAADSDHSGQLSQAEFLKAIEQPASALFRAVDANHDNQISAQEAESARNLVMTQLRALKVQEPANSARNMLRNGTSPEQVAPVPSFGTAAPTATPAPAAAPAAAQPPQR